MKKLILSAAIILGSLTTISAQEQTQDQSTVPTETTAPATQSAPMQEATVLKEFTEIKLEEVPTAVVDALKKEFPDATLSKASVNDKKEYQLQIKVEDKEGVLYVDETGKWIEN